MKIYILSIARNAKRLESLSNRLRLLGLEFEVFMGVDGEEITHEILERYDQSFYKNLYGRSMNKYEIACALGHIKLWERLASDGVGRALILEDDVYLTSVVPTVLDKLALQSDGVGIIYLHHGKAKKWPIYSRLAEGYRLYRYRSPTRKSRRAIIYATAYVLTCSAARRLTEIGKENMMPADFILGMIQRHRLVTKGVEPCCVDHGSFETSIPDRF